VLRPFVIKQEPQSPDGVSGDSKPFETPEAKAIVTVQAEDRTEISTKPKPGTIPLT
jgi:hypothetical protein